MEIHESQNTKHKRKATCGYCRTEGHNQYQCPHVRGDWENFLSKLMVPRKADGTFITRGYNSVYYGMGGFDPLKTELYNSGFSSWFSSCRKAYLVQKERGFNLKHKAKKNLKTTPQPKQKEIKRGQIAPKRNVKGGKRRPDD